MPVKHDPRTGKFMGGAGGFGASGKGQGLKKPLAKMPGVSVDKMARAHGEALAMYVQRTSLFDLPRKSLQGIKAKGISQMRGAWKGKNGFGDLERPYLFRRG